MINFSKNNIQNNKEMSQLNTIKYRFLTEQEK